MPLEDVTPQPTEERIGSLVLPESTKRLIADCEERYAEFNERSRDEPVVAFVQSDLSTIYRGLAWTLQKGLTTGNALLEWGSGVGAVALLGCQLGYAATGIEVDASLVEDARDLATIHELDVEFACGSFIPDDADVLPQDMDEFAWLDTDTLSAYDELGVDIDDFDLVFAYPWPGEQELLYELFETYASRGACLLTNHGVEGLRLHRKI